MNDACALDGSQAPTARLADLHWLLTSPDLLAPPVLPAGMAVGDAELGKRWWAQLDHEAAARMLAAEIKPSGPFRLGRYAERLLQAGLAPLPGHLLLAANLPVKEAGHSVGEFDFLLRQPDGLPLLHIELAVKFYIALPQAEGLRYVGPGLRDALDLKLARLFDHQLRLAQSPAGRAVLPPGATVQPMAWLRGRMFYRDVGEAAWAGLAVDHLRGWWRRWGEAWPRQREDSRWRGLAKPQWLASTQADPATPDFESCQAAAAAHFSSSRQPLMVAEYAPPDEGGVELARGILLPPGWPDPQLLAALPAFQAIRSGA